VDIAMARAVLGITPDTDLASAQKVFRARARLMHPDQAPAGIKSEAEKAMADLNEAWSVVRSDLQLQPRPEPAVATRPLRPPTADECALCGWRPAGLLTLRTTAGLLLWWRWHRLAETVCRDCGEAAYCEAQARSMTRGWWGIFAPIANLINMFRNRTELAQHRRRVGQRLARADEVVTPETSPYVRRSQFRRPMPMVASVIAAILLPVLAVGYYQDRFGSNTTTTVTVPSAPLGVGTCLTSTGMQVRCDLPDAFYTFTAPATDASVCATEGYPNAFTQPSTGAVWCAKPLRG
jgi:hypothetical protein